MSIWIFQAAFNVLMLVVAILWLVSRKRVEFLEEALRRLATKQSRLERGLEKDSPESLIAKNTDKPKSNEPKVDLRIGNLIEKKADQQISGSGTSAARLSPDAYERAATLLTQGMPPQKIARITGLSLSEIQLMNKMSTRNQ